MIVRRAVRPDGPLRVLFVVPDLAFGGAERHVITLLPRMDPQRFRPSLVCLHRAGEMFEDLSRTGVPATSLDRPSRQPWPLLRELVRIMRRERPDVVIARGRSAEILSRVAGVIARVPRLAVWVHNCSELGESGERDRVTRILDRVLEPVTAQVYGVAHGQVPYLTGERSHGREKIRIIHNGVEIADWPSPPLPRDGELADELGIAPDEPVVGIVAVMRREKEHARLLAAFAQVLDRVPRARLLLVGDGPLRAAVEQQAADLGITERVVFAGFRTDIVRVLTLVDVYTLCSRSECFPMSVLEAMAAGRPAVCTAVGGMPEMVEDGVTGHVVEVGDTEALARALTDLLGDPDKAHEMGQAARNRLEKEFTLERSVQAAQDAIAETAGRA